MDILYINTNGPDALHDCTANAALRVDAAVTDEICAPPEKGGEKTLDVLMIPGPDPWKYKSTEAINRFVRGHFESGTDVLTVCTGVYVAGAAGILKGKRATGPRELVPELKQKFPEALWEDKRWVSDGNLWNSGMLPGFFCSASWFFCYFWIRHLNASGADFTEGGITNGQDMVAAYIRDKWAGPTVEAMLAMAEVGERGQEY